METAQYIAQIAWIKQQEEKKEPVVPLIPLDTEIKTLSAAAAEALSQSCKERFKVIEEKLGVRTLAFSLADVYFAVTSGKAPCRYEALACQSFFPRILRNAELAEIFLTTLQLTTEHSRAWHDLFNPELPYGSAAWEDKLKTFEEADKRFSDYYRKIWIREQEQPLNEKEQPTTRPLICEEAQQWLEQLQPVPLEHITECPTCSVTQRGEKRQPDFASESKDAVT